MLTPLHRAGPQRTLDLTPSQQKSRSIQSRNIFQFENITGGRANLARHVGPVGQVPTTTTSQVLGTAAASRQNTVASASTATGSTSTAAAVTSSTTTASPNASTGSTDAASTSTAAAQPSDAAVLQSLKDALAAAGISTDGLGLSVHQDTVSYPGGSYLNRYISVQTNGHQEGLMTDLVAINPKVAVLDIKHMLGQG